MSDTTIIPQEWSWYDSAARMVGTTTKHHIHCLGARTFEFLYHTDTDPPTLEIKEPDGPATVGVACEIQLTNELTTRADDRGIYVGLGAHGEGYLRLYEDAPLDLGAGGDAQLRLHTDLVEVLKAIDFQGDVSFGGTELNLLDLAQRVATDEDNISNLQIEEASLDGRATALEGRAADLETRATALEGRATSLEGRATSLEGRATSLEGRATTLESQVTDLETRVGAIETTLTAMQAAWTDYSPAVTVGSGSISSLGTVVGRYRKVGKTVNIHIAVSITNAGNAGTWIAASLPTGAAAIAGKGGQHLRGMETVTGKAIDGWIQQNGSVAMLRAYDGTYLFGAYTYEVTGTYESA